MTVWQADFYRRPLHDEAGQPLWELLLCDRDRRFLALCPQPQVSAPWVTAQLQAFFAPTELPQRIQVFRPQTLALLESACQPLGITVEPTRHTPELKHWLQVRSQDYRSLPNYTGDPYNPIALDVPPPTPLPEALWGEQWRFAAIVAQDFEPGLVERSMPIRHLPPALMPQAMKLASTVFIPGVVIYGGRQAMRLARWVEDIHPVAMTAVAGELNGLVLEAGLVDRWIVATFDDPEAIAAAETYRHRLHATQGLHFLLIQPDDSGRTDTGLWLLRDEG